MMQLDATRRRWIAVTAGLAVVGWWLLLWRYGPHLPSLAIFVVCMASWIQALVVTLVIFGRRADWGRQAFRLVSCAFVDDVTLVPVISTMSIVLMCASIANLGLRRDAVFGIWDTPLVGLLSSRMRGRLG